MKKYILALVVPVLLCSCESWLDVKPNDRISEEATFSTPRGFELALNGVYVDLNKTNLYGRALTWDFVEVLAQRYAIDKNAKYNKEAMDFHYASDEVKSRVSGIWSTAYSLISNLNLILQNCDTRRDVLSDEYYSLVKGEALGLRALLHFDLFRLWGPVYSLASESELTIPYYASFALVAKPKLTASKFMEQVIADLEEAAGLLKDYDPAMEASGMLKPYAGNNFLGYRALRMNYYAVKLLLARAYLYVDNKEEALKAAKEVIEVQERLFPWIDPASLSTSSENLDRMFSTELVFALQNVNRKTIYTGSFDSDNLKIGALLIPDQKVVDNSIFDGETSDLRYKMWLDKNVELEGGSYKELMKYQITSTDSIYAQLIPMLRVSEAFYIAAECEGEEDAEAGIAWLNKVRNARALQGYPWYYYEYTLELEYIREFWGEGQLFFFYKRKNYDEISSAYDPYATVSMTPANYVLLIPESESKYN
ncbi:MULTISPECIES: RagB/SusD family nutrient uptake outer membrane protein [Butyricimonas]|uniref:RagB/SusD family nutrient uptake outer membrane protein n=1 Tax=Butyricimonas TaxID=574697 RepID=UPI0020858180|nr:RagB/SusD family nutrient uptake outer membrane protein [Butyricimonas paravirosa]BDF56552.1 hypothetical protein CE91St21_39870 [Odoribacteraceae bacterium]GKH95416.1 hypothetical protein CE91St23_39120 [Odoribacteraceae bacterium]GKH98040.1 hypothetical protein CE91St22_19180 [Odoribacteraceae bacterium]GKI01165.1 hypothetical protein CE91St24_04400 [Odoribacteraceae bacterium]